MSYLINTPLKTFQFDGTHLSVIDQNGEGWMVGEDIGKALDYSDPRDSISKLFERNRDELEEYSVTVKLTATDGKQYLTRVYNEEGVMVIGFLSGQPKAVAFRKWAVSILKSYRHGKYLDENALQTIQQKYISLLETETERLRQDVELAKLKDMNQTKAIDTIIKMELEGRQRHEIVAAVNSKDVNVRNAIYRARKAGLLPKIDKGGVQ